MNNSILIIEDDEGIREYLKETLLDEGFSVNHTGLGIKGLEIAEKVIPDVVLLDLKLPDIEGEEVCKRIKKTMPEVCVIILTAKDTPNDVVNGFNMGADDYVKKPFTGEEIIARIRARLKISDNATSLTVGDLFLNKNTMEIKRGNRNITLTPQEFTLLEYLMANKTRVLTREMILNKVWQYSPDTESRAVDVYIGYLRKKIDDGEKVKLIHSIRGFGYVLKEG